MEIVLRQLFRNNPQRYDKFLADKEADFAYISKNGNPYRVNAFLKTGKIGAVMRKIDMQPRNLEEIMFQNSAQSIKDHILASKKGLFLITLLMIFLILKLFIVFLIFISFYARQTDMQIGLNFTKI